MGKVERQRVRAGLSVQIGDETRKLGRQLDIPEDVVMCHPVPGGALPTESSGGGHALRDWLEQSHSAHYNFSASYRA